MAQGTITRRMNAVFNDLDSGLADLYTWEEIVGKIQALKEIRKKESSRRHEILKDLYRMLNAYGISYEEDQTAEYYEDLLQHEVVDYFSFHGVADRVLNLLYQRFSDFPSPSDFLKRVVDRNETDKAWKDDPLRLRILKQFIKYGNYLWDITHEKGGRNGAKPVTVHDVGGKKAIEDYVTSLPGYKPAKGAKSKKPDAETVCAYLDDGVFALLDHAKGEDKKISGKYGLLKIADDLAGGKFRTEGSTKKMLYYFAIVYGLTYEVHRNANEALTEDALANYTETDIEATLFRDYYANSLLSFLSAGPADGNLYQELDLDPSGESINYKNFAEMILLYYIAKKDLTPAEKLKKSNAMIRQVQAREAGTADTAAPQKGTKVLKDAFSEDILKLNEAAFEEYICEHYDCDTRGRYGVFQMYTSRNTAFACYKTLCALLKIVTQRIDATGVRITEKPKKKRSKKKGTELRFEPALEPWEPLQLPDSIPWKDATLKDIEVLRTRTDGLWIVSPLHKKFASDSPDKQRFMELLRNINCFFLPPEVSKTNGMNSVALSADKVTRAKLVAVYYYLFNAIYCYNLQGGDENEALLSFREVYKQFSAGLNKYLNAAGYEPFSSKNLMDVFTVFSAYAYRRD